MKCSLCGKTGESISIFHNPDTGKTDQICQSCMITMQSQSIKDLDEADRMLAEYEELSQRMESLIQSTPPEHMPEPMPGAFTPMSMFKGIQAAIADLKSRRMELLTQEGGEFRLRYELKKALAEEDYEKAEELRKKLAEEYSE